MSKQELEILIKYWIPTMRKNLRLLSKESYNKSVLGPTEKMIQQFEDAVKP